MDIVSGTLEVLPRGVYSKVGQYRHKVFVEQLGWDIPTQDGMELDQFDRPDTMYVVAQDSEGEVFGCARLLPTTRPYLLGELFPQLLNGLPPPSSPWLWELSRFAAVDYRSQTILETNQVSSPIAIKLLKESICCAAAQGAKQLITVSPVGVIRLLRMAGFQIPRVGPSKVIHGHPVLACWIECLDSSAKA